MRNRAHRPLKDKHLLSVLQVLSETVFVFFNSCAISLMAAPNSNGFMVPVKTNTRKSPYEGGHELERSSMRLYNLRRKKRADIQRARGTTEIKNVHSQRGAELMNPFGGAINQRCVALLNSLPSDPFGSTFSKHVDPNE